MKRVWIATCALGLMIAGACHSRPPPRVCEPPPREPKQKQTNLGFCPVDEPVEPGDAAPEGGDSAPDAPTG